MKTIPLTQGLVTHVDDEDYDRLAQHKWYAIEHPHKNITIWYAARTVRVSDNRQHLYMHREIAAVVGISDVDHRDSNGLNNQRTNLRPATRSQNSQNRLKQPGYSSSFKGVHWYKKYSKWRALIKIKGRSQHLGYFADEQDAAKAYNAAATKLFAEFAVLNETGS